MKFWYSAGATHAEIKQNTEALINAINDGQHIYVKIWYYKKNSQVQSPYDLNEDHISLNGGITFSTYLNPTNDYIYGKSASTECVIHFIKDSVTEEIDWTKEIAVNFGVELSGSIYYTLMGYYQGDFPNIIKDGGNDIYVFTGYDCLSLLDVNADDMISTLTFPCTAEEIYQQINTYLHNTFNMYFNWYYVTYNYTLQTNPFKSGMTIRNVIELLAESHQSYLCFRGQDVRGIQTVRMMHPAEFYGYDIDCTFTPDNYYEYAKPVIEVPTPAAVQFIDTEDPSNNQSEPATYTGVPYYITNNPIFNCLNSSQKTQLLGILYLGHNYGSQFQAKYLPSSLRAVGNYIVEVGDIIDVEDENGNVNPLWVFSCIIKWNGGSEGYYEYTGNLNREQQLPELTTTVTTTIVDSLDFSTKGMALDASQGKILNNSIGLVRSGLQDAQADIHDVQGDITSLSGKVDVIGTYKSSSNSGTKNFSNTSKTSGASVSLTKGVWVVHANCTINKTNSGQRSGLTITTTNNDGAYNANAYSLDVQRGSETANQYYNVAAVWNAGSAVTLYAMIFNGNISTSYAASIYAVRIA